jgi:hypothetical protein
VARPWLNGHSCPNDRLPTTPYLSVELLSSTKTAAKSLVCAD